MNTAWCIQHEHSVLVQDSIVGEIHEILGYNEFGMLDIDWCGFPMGWATCPPPENFEDDLLGIYWDDWILVPSNEELVEMDLEVV